MTSVLGDHRDLLLVDPGRPHAHHRRHRDLAVIEEPAKELMELAVAGRRRGGRDGVEQLLDEGLDVLPSDGADGGWHPPLAEEAIELAGRLHVVADRLGRQVRCS